MYGRFKVLDFLVYRFILRNPRLRNRVQRLLYPTDSRRVKLLGQSFLIDVQSEIGYYRASIANNSNIFFRDELPQLISFISLLRPGMCVVDAGANIGTWTVQIGSLGQIVTGLHVKAFEPNPTTFDRLRSNASAFTNIASYNVALSDKRRTLTFYDTVTSGAFSVKKGTFNEATNRHFRSIDAFPLDEFLVEEALIAVKIDVEGHELEVLRGLQSALQRDAVKVIFVDGLDPKDSDQFKLILSNHGFEIFNARTRTRGINEADYQTILATKN